MNHEPNENVIASLTHPCEEFISGINAVQIQVFVGFNSKMRNGEPIVKDSIQHSFTKRNKFIKK